MIGTLLNERYRLDSHLGQGGLGTLYRGHDLLLDRAVAVKLLSPGDIGTSGRVRLLSEAQAAAKLNHPNIVTIYDTGECPPIAEGRKPIPYIVMELIDGDTLFDRKPASLEETCRITVQLCNALEHAHQHGVIHRDIKPENVLLTRDGTVKLTDFGLARSVASRMTHDGTLIGTVYYIAPEMVLGEQVDARTDLYGLGVMLYELTAGRLPFMADDPLAVISQHLHAPVVPPSTYRPDLPPALDVLILRLLNKRPEDRYASAGEVRQALLEINQTPSEAALESPLSPLDRLVRGRLVGRAREFNEARLVWQQAAAGSGEQRVLLISGDPGMGKKYLAREVVALAEASGGKAFTIECYENSPPYAPITQVVHKALGMADLELPELLLQNLLPLSPELAVHPKIRNRFDLPAASPSHDLKNEQQRLMDSLVWLFTSLTERFPVLLVIENADDADGGTVQFLQYLARRSRANSLPLLILLTFQEAQIEATCCLGDILASLNRERLAQTIRLAPLTESQTGELLAVMFGQEVSSGFVRSIYRVTEGNLFFIEEISRALIEDGKVYREDGRWVLSESFNQLLLPQSIRLTIQSRVNKLPSEVQDVLRLGALIGREFDFDLLSQITDLDEEGLIQALEMAQRAQVIEELRPSGGPAVTSVRFAFAHGLIQENLKAEISMLRRARLHKRIAAALESLHPDDFETLANHYREGRDPDQASEYYERAGDRALSVYSSEDAVRLYSEALSLTQDGDALRFPLLEKRARLYGRLGRRKLQQADVEAMLEIANRLDEPALRCDALMAQSNLYLATDHTRADKPAGEALELANILGDSTRRAYALNLIGWQLMLKHEDPGRAQTVLEEAAGLFRQAGRLDKAAECLHTLSVAMGTQGMGDLQASQKYADEALALARQAGDRLQEATSLRRLAIAYSEDFQFDRALKYAEAALALHRKVGDRVGETSALNVLALQKAYLKDLDEAEACFKESLRIAEEVENSFNILASLGNMLIFCYRQTGRFEDALVLLDQELSKPIIQRDDFIKGSVQTHKAQLLSWMGHFQPALSLLDAVRSQPSFELIGSLDKAKLFFVSSLSHACLGNFTQAWQDYQAAKNLFGKSSQPNLIANLMLQEAYLAFIQGEVDVLAKGLEQARQAAALLEPTAWRFERADAHMVHGLTALASGELEEGWEAARHAYQLGKDLNLPQENYLYLYACGLWATGHAEEAQEYLERARDQVMRVAANLQVEDNRQAWLKNLPLNRNILAGVLDLRQKV